MKIDFNSVSDSIKSTDYNGGGAKTVLIASVGSAFLVVLTAGLVCYLYRRRSLTQKSTTTVLLKKSIPNERPITLKRPTAIKSPGSSGPGPVLKKSPSPTGAKSPPGGRDGGDKEKKGGGGEERAHGDDGKRIIIQMQQQEVTQKEQEIATQLTEAVKVEEPPMVEEKKKNVEDVEAGKVVGGLGLGSLHFKLKYNYTKRALCVTVNKCTDLPAKDPNASTSDPYVKLQLLPDKRHKVKTRVLRKTVNPVYDEDFTFLDVDSSQLEETTLHFVILSFDRYSRDTVIGEVLFPLAQITFDTLEKQVSLTRDIQPRNLKIRSLGRGEVLISLCWQPAASRLTVVVLKARNLPKMDMTGLCDPYVKIYLLCKNQRIAKKKTHVKKKTTSPVFNESFVFDVPSSEGLDNLSLELLLLDYDRVTRNEVIGKLEIGSSATGTAGKHWKDVVSSPRRQIAEWHKLIF